MKNYKILFVAVTMLGIASCQKYLDTNVNPNASQQSRPDLVLTSAQVYIPYSMGGRITEQLLSWNEYWTGDQSVVTNDWDKNNMTPSDAAAPWNLMYSRSLSSLKYLVDQSGQARYQGVAKILMAYEYQVLVDLYGDIPFTESLKGADTDPNTAPTVEDDAAIYPQLITMVDDGIQLVTTPTSGSVQEIQGDLMFDGNPDAWKTFGYALKLKLLMRQSNIRDVSAEVAALVAEAGGSGGFNFTGFTGTEYAGIEFEEDANSRLNANPLFTELQGGSLKNYFYASKSFMDYLLGTTDPRVDAQFTAPPSGPLAGTQVGLAQGDQQGIPPGTFYSRPKGGKWDDPVIGDPNQKMYGPNVPFILISNWEIDFLLAEAAARTMIADNAQTLYEMGVASSFSYWGLAGSEGAFLAAGSAALGTGGAYDATDINSQIKSIALQKWVSMNGIQAIESWIETRRMDTQLHPIFQSPGGIFMDPPLSVTPGVFPSILLYSETEVSLNPNVSQHPLSDKVFWDN